MTVAGKDALVQAVDELGESKRREEILLEEIRILKDEIKLLRTVVVADFKKHMRKVDFQEKEGLMKMVMMGATANLLNGSPGRDAKHVAHTAYQQAQACWEEWVIQGRKEGIVE
jgi:hypothetical protein